MLLFPGRMYQTHVAPAAGESDNGRNFGLKSESSTEQEDRELVMLDVEAGVGRCGEIQIKKEVEWDK